MRCSCYSLCCLRQVCCTTTEAFGTVMSDFNCASADILGDIRSLVLRLLIELSLKAEFVVVYLTKPPSISVQLGLR